MKQFTTKDSGKRQEFKTGSKRDTRDGKGRFDLVSPFSLARIAGVNERGAIKYGERNFELGQPISRYYDSAMRHLNQYLMGKDDEDHIAQCGWNILAIMHTESLIELGILSNDLDDMPKYLKKDIKSYSEYVNGLGK